MTITDTARTNRTTALATNEAQAVLMVRNGIDLVRVEDETGLTRAQIAAAVGRTDANRHARPTPANVPAPKADPFAAHRVPKPTVTRKSAPAEPAAPRVVVNGADLDAIEELLAWADEHGPSRAATLASRIRGHVDELRGIARRAEEVKERHDEVERLTAQLAAAREALRLANGQKQKAAAASSAPSMDRARSRQIREWARENGHQVSDRGSIPAAVLSAFDAAHQE